MRARWKVDPLVADSAGWSCLRFASSKMRAEYLLPLSTRAVEAVRSQRRHLAERGPENPAWLFPSEDVRFAVEFRAVQPQVA